MPWKHLARLLTILALLLAPLGMLGGHAAMAAPSAAASGSHCADMGALHQAPDETPPAKSIDCIVACACVPPQVAELEAAPSLIKAPAISGLTTGVAGSSPAADTPPPRLS